MTGSSTLCGLGVVCKTSTGIVEGIDEEKGGCTSSTTGSDIASKPLPVTVVLLETEQGLEVILYRQTTISDASTFVGMPRTEGKVERLGGEVSDDVRGVSSPE